MARGDETAALRAARAAAGSDSGRASGDPGATVVGLDVGGTKVAAAAYRADELPAPARLVAEAEAPPGGGEAAGHPAPAGVRREPEPPRPLSTERHATPRDAGKLLDLLAALVTELERRVGPVAAVGVGFPSGIDQGAGRAIGVVNLPVEDVPLRAELERRLPGKRIAVDNDANVAALAEAALRGVGDLVLLTLGTGVGGGVVSGGRLLRGADGLGAELGHFPLRADGPPCPGRCPGRGCVEALCSGQALARDARELAETRPTSALGQLLRERGELTARDVTDAARAGDADARWLVERMARDLGAALAGYANVFQPRVIAIGGGLGAAHELFLARAQAEAGRLALQHVWERCRVAPARAGEAAGTLGAALVALAP